MSAPKRTSKPDEVGEQKGERFDKRAPDFAREVLLLCALCTSSGALDRGAYAKSCTPTGEHRLSRPP